MQLVAIAYHEAGHAFLSYALGKQFKEVTIIPDEDKLGSVTNICDYYFLANLISESSNFLLPAIVIENRVKNELMVLYAGYLAAKEFGDDNEVAASLDLETINVFLNRYCDDEQESIELIKYCIETTSTILRDNWIQISALANALLDKKIMSFSEVDELLKNLNINE